MTTKLPQSDSDMFPCTECECPDFVEDGAISTICNRRTCKHDAQAHRVVPAQSGRK